MKGMRKAKSKVSKVSESENDKHDDGTWTPTSSPQPSSSLQVYTIREVGYDDHGLFSHWKTAPNIDKKCVGMKIGFGVYEQVDDHELVIDFGCVGHVVCPANDVALQHYGQKVVYGQVTTNSGRRFLIQITF